MSEISDFVDTPSTMIIFGITGDLSQRKLLPALYHLLKDGRLPHATRIIGISRRDVTIESVFEHLADFVGDDCDLGIVEKLRAMSELRQMDLADESSYVQLLDHIKSIEATIGPSTRLYYLSIPPQAFISIITLLGQTSHNRDAGGERDGARLLIEKPFGVDAASAHQLITTLGRFFSESQIYRIDHYVAKEAAQNILHFRFQNVLFQPAWNRQYIKRIAVVAHEAISIESRAAFYEETGALRDFVQSHLLQLLALVTMDEVDDMDSDHIHARKLALLQAIRPIAASEVATRAMRAQYEGYRDEVQNSDSWVETYARLDLQIDSDRWRDVELVVETGKALPERRTEIIVDFTCPPSLALCSSRLVFQIQPQEGVTVSLTVKQPGIDDQIALIPMSFDYREVFRARSVDAYERVVVDSLRADHSLFTTDAEVLACWRIIENVVQNWKTSGDGLLSYPQGHLPDLAE